MRRLRHEGFNYVDNLRLLSTGKLRQIVEDALRTALRAACGSRLDLRAENLLDGDAKNLRQLRGRCQSRKVSVL